MRNLLIFEDHHLDINSICIHNVEFSCPSVTVTRPRCLRTIHFNEVVWFFDGATKDGYCAVGVALFINSLHTFKFKVHCGTDINMKAELLALWCLCKVPTVFGIMSLQVFGDSVVTIKWVLGEYNLKVLSLSPWCYRTGGVIEFIKI